MRVYLYTTLGCHLCEQALELLQHCAANSSSPLIIEAVEISESDDLMSAYGIRIPVVRASHSDAELGWPFDLQQLQNFLQDAAATAD